MSIAAIMTWTLQSEIPVPQDAQALLGPGESAVAAFATFRDSAIFTTHRLIIRDAQGLTGKKVEMYSLPYSSIHMWSSENAGNLFDIYENQFHLRLSGRKIEDGPPAQRAHLDQGEDF